MLDLMSTNKLYFRRPSIFIFPVFVLATWCAIATASEPVSIRYQLAQPCRVSLAIYDKDGIQIRTLRNAEPQSAGEHAIVWDGLDQDGKPAPAGTYTWKLLQ